MSAQHNFFNQLKWPFVSLYVVEFFMGPTFWILSSKNISFKKINTFLSNYQQTSRFSNEDSKLPPPEDLINILLILPLNLNSFSYNDLTTIWKVQLVLDTDPRPAAVKRDPTWLDSVNPWRPLMYDSVLGQCHSVLHTNTGTHSMRINPTVEYILGWGLMNC